MQLNLCGCWFVLASWTRDERDRRGGHDSTEGRIRPSLPNMAGYMPYLNDLKSLSNVISKSGFISKVGFKKLGVTITVPCDLHRSTSMEWEVGKRSSSMRPVCDSMTSTSLKHWFKINSRSEIAKTILQLQNRSNVSKYGWGCSRVANQLVNESPNHEWSGQRSSVLRNDFHRRLLQSFRFPSRDGMG